MMSLDVRPVCGCVEEVNPSMFCTRCMQFSWAATKAHMRPEGELCVLVVEAASCLLGVLGT